MSTDTNREPTEQDWADFAAWASESKDEPIAWLKPLSHHRHGNHPMTTTPPDNQGAAITSPVAQKSTPQTVVRAHKLPGMREARRKSSRYLTGRSRGLATSPGDLIADRRAP